MNASFNPDYAAPPGDMLAETIEYLGITQTELARRMGRPIKTINEIIQAKAAVTADTALELERVLGVPAHLWMNMEANYREHLARNRAAERLEVDEEWLGGLPISWMQKGGMIPKTKDKRELMVAILSFSGCATVASWKEIWMNPKVAYRKSPKLESKAGAVAVWLRKAELEGWSQECTAFDATRFEAALTELRKATKLPPKDWVGTIRKACNACGVAYVLLPGFTGIPVSGATRQLNDDRMLIVQTGRYKDDGHFWFTFFHEARHVLQGKLRKDWLMEYEGNEDELEYDANRFAREFLVPSERIIETKRRHEGRMPLAAGRALANELGISAGIVAGRFHFDGIWKQFTGNELKVRYQIDELLSAEVMA
jgi:HTH-type transcriptional regulator / antitoxin HigA